jgi:hypothetical protein
MYRDDPDAFAKRVLERVEAGAKAKPCTSCARASGDTWKLFLVVVGMLAFTLAIVGGILANNVLVPPSREEECRGACRSLTRHVVVVTVDRCECGAD